MKNERFKKSFHERDWHFCKIDHPLLLIDSIHILLFIFAIVCFFSSHLPNFPWASRGRANNTRRMRMWVEDKGRQNRPDLSALGVAPCHRWTWFSWWWRPDRAIHPLPVSQQGHSGWPGSMLSTAMVGALVRGWRNRSSPRRAESRLLIPQSQDGMRTQGMLVMLCCGCMILFKGLGRW